MICNVLAVVERRQEGAKLYSGKSLEKLIGATLNFDSRPVGPMSPGCGDRKSVV